MNFSIPEAKNGIPVVKINKKKEKSGSLEVKGVPMGNENGKSKINGGIFSDMPQSGLLRPDGGIKQFFEMLRVTL